jgi:MYXO-CTERM domain-containing protein
MKHSKKRSTLKRSTFSTFARATVFGLSVLLLPLSTPTFAQTTTPTPDPQRIETRDDRDYTGLWGLLGLAGLLGLMGRRRPDTVHAYPDARERSRT